MSESFKDHFSGHAAEYAAGRPTYPPELFEWLSKLSPSRTTAWDCATGNGQAAVALASYFQTVHATDASADQVASAQPHPKVQYSVARAEASGLQTDSIDLVTVAQALHWFEFEAFFEESRRVLRPGGKCVAWTYELAMVTPEIDRLILDFYEGPIHTFWPAERIHVKTGYQAIPFPFEPIEVPDFEMSQMWTCDQLLAYVRTWSAVKRCIREHGSDPVELLASPLSDLWGDVRRKVIWPLAFLAGRVQ